MLIKSVPVDFVMIGTELIGIAIGSVLGPITSKHIPEIWLKRIFVVLAVYVGIGYLSKGFMGHSIVPPFGMILNSKRQGPVASGPRRP